jgi:hypothetical protein
MYKNILTKIHHKTPLLNTNILTTLRATIHINIDLYYFQDSSEPLISKDKSEHFQKELIKRNSHWSH